VSEFPTDAWFYTATGERLGPVDFDRLRELAATGQLNPRVDLCWTKGMDDWRPAGEIDGLYDKKKPTANAETLNDAQDLPRLPQDVSKLSESELELRLLEAGWPGASRRIYLAGILLMPLLVTGLLAVMAYFFLNLEDQKDIEVFFIAAGVAGLILTVLLIYIALERFRNLGMSRWWFLGNMVPILNLWIGFRLICCPAGYEYHRKMDRAGLFLAVLYWGHIAFFMIVSLLSIIAPFHDGIGALFESFGSFLESIFDKSEETSNVAPPEQP